MPPSTRKKPRTAVKRATGPKVPVERKDQGYTRVPVSDVWVSDDDIGKHPTQKYDWIGIGDKAVEGAKTHPDDWLLVAEHAPSSVSSNITAGRIATLCSERFVGWKFRGRITDMVMNDKGKHTHGRVWIKATRSTVDL
jgi:hypothetical protein